MNKLNFSILTLGILLLATSTSANSNLFKNLKNYKDVNGGVNCAVCTVLVSLTEQLAIVYNDTIENSLTKLCNYLPDGVFRITCNTAVEYFGPIIIDGLYSKETPDVICHAITICRTDPGQPECHILPSNKDKIQNKVSLFKRNLKLKNIIIPYMDSKICNMPIFKQICDYINNIFNNHEPGVDIDKDGHSTFATLRGTSWKGKDCNDFSANSRPGVKPVNGDFFEDTNCNGIFGRIPNSTDTYEEKFCSNSNQLGYAVLGDSISAHFHIPEQWLDPTQINEAVFEHLAFILENELDWPELSASTGYMNSTWKVIDGPTRSIYLNLLAKNRCNFRDYQNVAVNGARTGSMIDISKSLSRKQNQDQPMLVIYSLVGNDVCNGHPDTFDHMTKPDEFYKNVVTTMNYLDTVLPKGSHVLLTGLANGSVLYDSLGERIYPLGKVKNDIRYSDVYTFLSCLQISPCNGWMTVNATEREMTSNYALLLSGIVKNVTQTHKYNNFDTGYSDLPIDIIFDKWEKMGGERWQLIEPVDGFHINQIGHGLMADAIWDFLVTEYPNWLGPDNVHNADIIKIFGDQGGY